MLGENRHREIAPIPSGTSESNFRNERLNEKAERILSVFSFFSANISSNWEFFVDYFKVPLTFLQNGYIIDNMGIIC